MLVCPQEFYDEESFDEWAQCLAGILNKHLNNIGIPHTSYRRRRSRNRRSLKAAGYQLFSAAGYDQLLSGRTQGRERE